jgi:hypothetical protein
MAKIRTVFLKYAIKIMAFFAILIVNFLGQFFDGFLKLSKLLKKLL